MSTHKTMGLGGSEGPASGWGAPVAASAASGWGSSSGTQSSGSGSGWNVASSSSSNHWGSSNSSAPRQQSNGEVESSLSASPPKLSSSWAQAVINSGPTNQSLAPCSISNSSCLTNSGSHCDNSTEKKSEQPDKEPTKRSVQAAAAVAQLERASLSDNWGNAVINQDRSWDLPPSPESSPKESSSVWRSTSTSGTEIWETTVRHKTKGSGGTGAQSVQAEAPAKAFHTPSSHIGGTWGEEEDSSIVWQGVPQTNGGSGSSHSNASSGSNHGGHGGNSNNSWNSSSPGQAPHQYQRQQPQYEVHSSSAESGHAPLWKQPPPQSLPPQHHNNNQSHHLHNPQQSSVRSVDEQAPPPPRQNSNAQWGSQGSSASSSWGEPEPIKGSDNGTSLWGGGSGGGSDRRQPPAPSAVVQAVMPPKSADASSFGNWSPPVKNQAHHSQGWDEEERLKNGGLDKGSRGSSLDDGTAVWGNPVRQSKPVARWKEELQNAKSSNCVNGNNAPQSLSGGANSLSSNLSPTSPGLVRLPHGGAPPLASKPNDVWAKSQQTPQMNRLNPWSEGGGGGPGPNMGHQPHPQSPNHISSRDPSLATPGWGSMDASGNVGVHGLANDAQHSPLSGNSGISSKSVPGTPNTPSSSGSGWGSIDASSPNNPQQYWGQKARSSNSWSDNMREGQIDTSSWSGPKQKPISKEMIWASKQFRMLVDMGYKRDDVENVLRATNMNYDEAIGELRAYAARESALEIDSKVKAPGLDSNTPNLLTSSGHAMSSLTSISSRSPLMPHNMMVHGPERSMNQPPPQQPPPQAFPSVNQVQSALQRNQQPRVGPTQNNPPSEKQLLHLVQQIQLAVHSGHLNAQILNQPLAPPTIQLIYQLLQQIKLLAQLQREIASSMPKPGVLVPGGNPAYNQSNLHVEITKAKQRISNFQNQIAVQQALFLKQQQQQQLFPQQGVNANNTGARVGQNQQQHPLHEFLKSGEANIGLASAEYRDLITSEFKHQSQSRLKTTWKLGSFEDDDAQSDFSRAPGSSAKQMALGGMGAAVGRGDVNSWSGLDDSPSWSDGTSNGPSLEQQQLLKDASMMAANVSSSSGQSPYNDLVPEFEPGKPWKGSAHLSKSVEDDPHMTPAQFQQFSAGAASVNRSPLSSSTTLFNNWPSKVSPPANDPLASSLSLSSSTWAFTPAANNLQQLYNEQTNSNSSSAKSSSRSWGSPQAETCVDGLWGEAGNNGGGNGGGDARSVSKPRGPPPGLAQVGKSAGVVQNGVGGGDWRSNSGPSSAGSGNGSFWSSSESQGSRMDGSNLKSPNSSKLCRCGSDGPGQQMAGDGSGHSHVHHHGQGHGQHQHASVSGNANMNANVGNANVNSVSSSLGRGNDGRDSRDVSGALGQRPPPSSPHLGLGGSGGVGNANPNAVSAGGLWPAFDLWDSASSN